MLARRALDGRCGLDDFGVQKRIMRVGVLVHACAPRLAGSSHARGALDVLVVRVPVRPGKDGAVLVDLAERVAHLCKKLSSAKVREGLSCCGAMLTM